jgi:hypothetical protein
MQIMACEAGLAGAFQHRGQVLGEILEIQVAV